ncbi:CPBP family intramembrane glutamic endopeptidase [Burkholderia thailandensis]|uniref:CPBP family intramembrane glutamic endopeptidase n=1 Tax=Burkholderia thailandensis TaxID=57975 RepID=UPI0003EC743E|nr:CPBP family intramembrane glutamic endopeptidase [Burkholderia thailandensis]AHI82701.1 CAAX protease self-immunity family protein [Burkholderia thailandensis E444]AIT24270.1 CAAX protease self-immunity family protein [Burkholderia thailandensis E254]AWY65821.1 CPBP family intramembrane metalloprotease domain-containing protein [Burkholderia thailandensis]KVG09454.1 CAAX protease [Burkholderia thailandensis]MBS2131418.1 CPBP family intramembrane metalloprotease [Burkholderia thailandensis]
MGDVNKTGWPPPSPPRLKRIWHGPDGLRAGWAVLLYAAIVAAIMLALGVAARIAHHPLHPRSDLSAAGQIPFELALCAAALIATHAMSRIDRRSWLDYGLRAPRGALHFVWGAFCSLAAVSAIMGLLVAAGGATIEYSGASRTAAFESAVAWAATFALVALAEEVAFRGYPFLKLARRTHPVVAAALTSLAFGISHVSNRNENIAGIVPVVIYGLVACLSIWRTGSLWWALGEHAMWDWSESFLFGAADSGLTAHDTLFRSHAIGPVWLSGGTVGPEASVLVFPALAALAYVAWRLPPHAAWNGSTLAHARRQTV